MQFSLPDNSNPKRGEPGVTNFSNSQKKVTTFCGSYHRFSCELSLETFLWLIVIVFFEAHSGAYVMRITAQKSRKEKDRVR